MNFEFQGHRVHDYPVSEQTLAKSCPEGSVETPGLLHSGRIRAVLFHLAGAEKCGRNLLIGRNPRR